MREEILSRIRSALSGGPAHDRVHPPPSPPIFQSVEQPDREGLMRRFEAELKSVGGHFYAAEDPRAARDYILDLAAAQRARSAVGWDCPTIEQLGLVRALEETGISFFPDNGSDDFIQRAVDAGLGISGVDYALADTGSLVVLSGPGHARSVSLLPPIHVALVKSDQMLSDLNDLFPLLKKRGSLSSAIAFITGPSRTADIEMTLVVGVHGPQQLHVVLLPVE